MEKAKLNEEKHKRRNIIFIAQSYIDRKKYFNAISSHLM